MTTPIVSSDVVSNGPVSKYPISNASGTITANVINDLKAAELLFIDRAKYGCGCLSYGSIDSIAPQKNRQPDYSRRHEVINTGTTRIAAKIKSHVIIPRVFPKDFLLSAPAECPVCTMDGRKYKTNGSQNRGADGSASGTFLIPPTEQKLRGGRLLKLQPPGCRVRPRCAHGLNPLKEPRGTWRLMLHVPQGSACR